MNFLNRSLTSPSCPLQTSAPSSPATPQHDETARHPRKRITAVPSSSAEKTPSTPQAEAAAGKRPKREVVVPQRYR